MNNHNLKTLRLEKPSFFFFLLLLLLLPSSSFFFFLLGNIYGGGWYFLHDAYDRNGIDEEKEKKFKWTTRVLVEPSNPADFKTESSNSAAFST